MFMAGSQSVLTIMFFVGGLYVSSIDKTLRKMSNTLNEAVTDVAVHDSRLQSHGERIEKLEG